MAEENPFARIFDRPSKPVRLAVLKAGEQHDPLDISIINADPKDTTYDCISYDRSSDLGSVEVQVEGQPQKMPKPLVTALQALRQDHRPRTLWADLLLGSTVEERSTQPSEMKNVFEHANTVVAWLGAGNHGAVDMLQNLANKWHQARLHSNFPQYSNRATQQQMMDAHAHLLCSPMEVLQPSNPSLWKEIQEIFDTSYFQTTQSIPEIVLAKSVRVTIGEKSISWEDFNAALMAYLMLAPSLQLPMSATFQDSFQRISRLELATNRKKNGESLELLAMIKDARRTTSSDPREIIFSMLPIINPCLRTENDPKRPTPPKVDYSKTTAEVFKEASKYIIEERQDVMLWWNERPPCGRRLSSLPSWATDFTTPLPIDNPYISPSNGLRAWKDPLQCKRIYVDENDGLHIQAHALDRIVSVSKIFTEENCRRLCLEQFQQLPQFPGESLADKIDKFWRALCLNINSERGETIAQFTIPPPETWLNFQSLIAEERIMSLLGVTMEQLQSQDPELIARARANEDVQVLGPCTGQSENFEILLRTNAIGRRFLLTESGRVGMTAIEEPAPPSEEEPQLPSANFDEAMSEPIGQAMLAGFQSYLAERNFEGRDAHLANILSQALEHNLPGQRRPGVRSNDLVVAVVGGFQPYILRPLGQIGEDDSYHLDAASKYTYVGDCYLHGVMDGECFRESGNTSTGAVRYRDVQTVDITIV